MNATVKITGDVLAELARAVGKFPSWPVDPLHALAVLGEEYGELTQAVLQRTYDRNVSIEHVREEALQTAAMAIRFLQGLPHYQFSESEQVEMPL